MTSGSLLRRGEQVVFPLGEYSMRSPRPEDVADLLPQKNDPEIRALLGGEGPAYTEASMLLWVERHRVAEDEAFFVIVGASGRVVGHVALYRIDRRVGSAEFGILIGDKAVWGTGLGEAAVRWMVEYGFAALSLQRIYLEVIDRNPRARRLYQRIGFLDEGCLRRHQRKGETLVDVYVMGLLREEYQALPSGPLFQAS